MPSNRQTLLSPAELSYIHTSLSAHPPLRPDLRTPTQFRPLIAETDFLPSTNGSARVCFSDGTEAIVGVKAELEKAKGFPVAEQDDLKESGGDSREVIDVDVEDGAPVSQQKRQGRDSWLEVAIEIPSYRDDDTLPVFLNAMLSEALLANGELRERLYINKRWHWRLYVDALLLSQPLSYPLPLLSLTTHLALLTTSFPRLTSDPEDDPIFDDDWAAATPLYPRGTPSAHPPITLLVMTVADNIVFDPSREELAVADAVLAISIAKRSDSETPTDEASGLTLLSIRAVDAPSRSTPPGVADSVNPANAAAAGDGIIEKQIVSAVDKEKVWTPPKGGMKSRLLARLLKLVLEKDGVGEEVMDGLAGFTG